MVRSAPLDTSGMPPGMGHILTNELAERFSYYGMTAILIPFMTKCLLDSDGQPAIMGDNEATMWFHVFTAAVYLTPLLGAFIADLWWGKYWTIVVFSVVYCLGLGWLTWDQTRIGLAGAMALVALGSGVIKPCVSANVGDQFGQRNKHLVQPMYSWFYFAINLGACVSMLLCPWLLKKYGARVAFGVPAVSMILATSVFAWGRSRYTHIPPRGRAVLQELCRPGALTPLKKLIPIYLLVSMFFALFYQSQSAWVLQAESMNRHWLGVDWLPAQVQFSNSLFILIMVPLFSYVIYPWIGRFVRLTDLRKIGAGMFVTAVCFSVSIWIETRIARGIAPSIGWQFFGYVLLTAAEVMVSVTVLEFSYTQAPKSMKSLVMSLYLLAISLGNIFTALVNHFIENEDGSSKLAGASYYVFFTVVILVTAVLFIPVARRYPVQEYIQDGKD